MRVWGAVGELQTGGRGGLDRLSGEHRRGRRGHRALPTGATDRRGPASRRWSGPRPGPLLPDGAGNGCNVPTTGATVRSSPRPERRPASRPARRAGAQAPRSGLRPSWADRAGWTPLSGIDVKPDRCTVGGADRRRKADRLPPRRSSPSGASLRCRAAGLRFQRGGSQRHGTARVALSDSAATGESTLDDDSSAGRPRRLLTLRRRRWPPPPRRPVLSPVPRPGRHRPLHPSAGKALLPSGARTPLLRPVVTPDRRPQ